MSGQGGQYWQLLCSIQHLTAEKLAASELRQVGFDREQALQALRQRMKTEEVPFSLDARDLLKGDKPVGLRTYEVDINADPATFLGLG